MKQIGTDSQFNATELGFIEILANPEVLMTDEEAGNKLGVSRSTIQRMKKRDDIWEAVNALAYANLFKDLPEVYGALASKAKAGNIKAIELLLKFLGKYMDKQEIKVEATIEADRMTDEELNKAVAEMERLKKLQEGGQGNE